MLEEYQQSLGAEEGIVKKAMGKAMGVARDLADSARESDFLRLVGDIVMARQSEDTFKTFREAGKALSIEPLQRIGDIGERHHDEYVKEFEAAGYKVLFEELEDHDSEVSWQGEGRTGQVALREDCDGGKIYVHITNRPA